MSSRAHVAARCGHIVRIGPLGLISEYLSAHAAESGMPSAVTASLKHIFIGTSLGLVHVFDSQQRLRHTLGDASATEQRGAVTCVAVDRFAGHTAAGFEHGCIVVWDMTAHTEVYVVPAAHNDVFDSRAVLRLCYADSDTLVSLGGATGSVHVHTWRRLVVGARLHSECVMSGSAAPGLDLATVAALAPRQAGDLGLSRFAALAVIASDRLLIFDLLPTKWVARAMPRSDSVAEANMGAVAWGELRDTEQDSDRANAQLVYGWAGVVHVIRVWWDEAGSIAETQPVRDVPVPSAVLLLTLLPSDLLFVFSHGRGASHAIVDTRDGLTVDSLPAAKLHPVAHSRHLLLAGGTVPCISGSVASTRANLFALTPNGVLAVHMLSWKERLAALVRDGRIEDSLHMCEALLQDTSRESQQWEDVVGYVRTLLCACIQAAVDVQDTDAVQAQGIVRAAFAVATMGECTDALLEEGFELLPGEGPVMAAYMDELAAGIVAETVVSVPPTVTQALLSHLEASRQYGTIEQCLVRMDLASVDIHNTMAACSRYHLHDARIALQAYALMQPAAPLQDLLEDPGEMRNRILLYLHCALTRRRYPFAAYIDTSVADFVQSAVFAAVFEDETVMSALMEAPTDFLHMLGHVLDDPGSMALDVQQVADAVLQFKDDGVLVYVFIGRLLSRWPGRLTMPREVLEAMVVALSSGPPEIVAERQEAFLGVLSTGAVDELGDDLILDLAWRGKCYRVCEVLYRARGDVDGIIRSFLSDSARKAQVFAAIAEQARTGADGVSEAVLAHWPVLVDASAEEAAELLHRLGLSVTDAYARLSNDPKAQLAFLDACFNDPAPLRARDFAERHPDLHGRYLELQCMYRPEAVLEYVRHAQAYRLDEFLAICLRHKAMGAAAWLLAERGEVYRAVETVCKLLSEEGTAGAELVDLVRLAVDFCNLCPDDQETWLLLLRAVTGRKCAAAEKRELLQLLANGLVGTRHSLERLARELLPTASAQGAPDDAAEAVGVFFEVLRANQSILSTANAVISKEDRSTAAACTRALLRGVSPTSDVCSACRGDVRIVAPMKPSQGVALFYCGHVYHIRCIEATGSTLCPRCTAMASARRGAAAAGGSSSPPAVLPPAAADAHDDDSGSRVSAGSRMDGLLT